MTDNAAIVACVALVTLGAIATPLVHGNEREYQAQRACMAERGNWETRENNSREIGCRFPSKATPAAAGK